MKKKTSPFNARQYMLRRDFEAFYYSDQHPEPVAQHSHSFYEFLFLLEGSLSYRMEDAVHELRAGDLLIIPPGLRHQPQFTGGSRYSRVVLWIAEDVLRSYVDGASLDLWTKQVFGSEDGFHMRTDTYDSSELMGLAMMLADELSHPKAYGQTMSMLLVTQLLILIDRLLSAHADRAQTDETQQLVRRVTEYIDGHLEEELRLDDLADRFFISKFHLAKVFKKHMGTSPHSYITQRRLFHAKQLLYNGMSPTQVYKRCGWSDYSSFYRAFKDKYGYSPRQLSAVAPDNLP